MSANCPTCGKPLDPLRAPAVKVIAGRITAFCSPACAGRAQTEPSMPVVVPAKESIQISAIPPEKSAAARTAAAAETERAKAAAPKAAATIVEDEDDERDEHDHADHDDGVDEPDHPPYDAPYDEPDDDHGSAPRATARRPRRRGPRIVLLTAGLVAAGGAVVVLSKLVSPSHPIQAAAHDSAPPQPLTPKTPPRPAHADPAAVYARARDTLGQLLASPSDRVRRLAALALARIGDPPALDALGKALEAEPSAIARIQVAFALARAGDPRGKQALAAGLASPRRDVRGDAATDLVLLGDKAGVAFLTDAMGLEQMRLSAAETLARAGDAKAIAALRAVLADAKAPKEEHERALRALAAAGQADVAPALRAALADKGETPKSLTAQALARLGDPAAASQLTDDLDVESLRVDAAVALRRLDATLAQHLDPAIWADHLAPALAAGRDTDQATAAEAALILFGQSTLAEHE